MKQNSQKQGAGVWIDGEKAIIIASNPNDESSEYAIQDKVKTEASFSSGSEHTINNSKQSGNLKYFKSVSALLSSYDEILIFGPGKAQEQFKNHLQEDSQFKNTKIEIDSAEHLTDPQMIAKVREFFKK